MNLVDTSAWIEYFFAGPNASYFSKPIEKTDQLLIPTICLYEVFKKITQTADESRALQAVAQMKQGRVADLTEDIALSASLTSIQHKLPMADSLIYATGLAESARATAIPITTTFLTVTSSLGLPDGRRATRPAALPSGANRFHDEIGEEVVASLVEVAAVVGVDDFGNADEDIGRIAELDTPLAQGCTPLSQERIERGGVLPIR